MIPKRIAAILACPKCKSSPTIGKTVFCPECGSNYPIVDDVPIMHMKNKRAKIEKDILGTKSAYNLTSFSETISKEKKFLLSSQYNNPDEIRMWPSFIYKMGRKLYPPAPVLNRVINVRLDAQRCHPLMLRPKALRE